MEKQKPRDVCAICGKEIAPNTVFILRRTYDRNGGQMKPVHIMCSVLQREQMEAGKRSS